MAGRRFHPGELVVYRRTEFGSQPAPNARHVSPTPNGESYSYCVDKYWRVLGIEADGSLLGQKVTPLDRAGIYVPGGKAAYPSSLLMNAIPAQVAGVPSLALASPPQAEFDGLPHPTILAACALLGVEEVYAVGGAQAVALLTRGDRVQLEEVRLLGHQDTFEAERVTGRPGRVLVRRSEIRGDVDFIFGGATLVIDDSLIVSRAGRRQAGQELPDGNQGRVQDPRFAGEGLRGAERCGRAAGLHPGLRNPGKGF